MGPLWAIRQRRGPVAGASTGAEISTLAAAKVELRTGPNIGVGRFCGSVRDYQLPSRRSISDCHRIPRNRRAAAARARRGDQGGGGNFAMEQCRRWRTTATVSQCGPGSHRCSSRDDSCARSASMTSQPGVNGGTRERAAAAAPARPWPGWCRRASHRRTARPSIPQWRAVTRSLAALA